MAGRMGMGMSGLLVFVGAVTSAASVACQTERIIIVREPTAASASAAPVSSLSKPPEPPPAVAPSPGNGAGDIATAGGNGAPDGTNPGGPWGIVEGRDRDPTFARVVDKVANMTSDSGTSARVSRRGLSLVNVMWEDTGRYQGSSVGPNISDLTLQVRRREGAGFAASLMPVIRPPNFADRTGDIPADKFFVRVGNERRSGDLRTVPLNEVLRDLHAFASDPDGLVGSGDLTAPRDSHLLVSAQAVFLPIPLQGKAEFNPVLFNYQSSPGAPAVLTLLVTREGTSMAVIENRGDERSSMGLGQELNFNDRGQRAAFTAERRSDVQARIDAKGGPTTEDERSALAKGADVLFLVQVPLKHETLRRSPPTGGVAALGSGAGSGAAAPKAAAAPAMESASADKKSNVEQAVLGHGPHLGPYREGRGARLVRDPRFPIRVTVQFYKATSNGVVSDADLDGIARSIGSVYEHADYVGSLVLPEGDARRPTAWQKMPREWFPW